MYIIVSPFSKTFDDNWILYFVPNEFKSNISIWIIVKIPLRSSIEVWVVLNIIESNKIKINIDKIKPIISIQNNIIFLRDYQIQIIFWMSSFYLTPIHNCLNLFFPKNLRLKIKNNKFKINIEQIDNLEYIYNNEKKINIDQQISYDWIVNSKKNILLHWITWSWKTEIYIKLIKDTIDSWKQALLLIPEIILTNQISKKIISIFWNNVSIINSSISDWKKFDTWVKIYKWESKILIGTRSALFYPFLNLWLIIIDEEHDNSYISSSAPRYNSIEIALFLSKLTWAKLILGSWTPNVISMYNWLNWKFKIISLLNKFIPS